MSKEAREFLEDNNYDFHTNALFVKDDELGEVFEISVDLPNLMEEYFAFRLGKLLLDGDVRMCKDGK